MREFKQVQVLAAVLLILLSSSCGFALRGTTDLPPELQTLQVVSLDPNSELLAEVIRALRSNRVTITDNAGAYRLGLGRETGTERTLSVNANARAGEYELEMGVLFQLSQGGSILLGPETVSLSRVYLSDPENAVAKTEEAELIRQEMRRELAQQILRRLQVAPLQ